MVEEPVLLLATAMEDQVSTLLLSPPLHLTPALVTTLTEEEFLEVVELLHHLHREEMTPAPVLVLMKREALVVLPPSTREV